MGKAKKLSKEYIPPSFTWRIGQDGREAYEYLVDQAYIDNPSAPVGSRTIKRILLEHKRDHGSAICKAVKEIIMKDETVKEMSIQLINSIVEQKLEKERDRIRKEELERMHKEIVASLKKEAESGSS